VSVAAAPAAAAPPGAARRDPAAPPVVFAVFQTGDRSNGGVESITQVIERVRRVRPVVVTQLETPVNERWRAAGARVEVWPIPYRPGAAMGRRPLEIARRAASIAATNLRMRRLVREVGARVVHCNDISALMHTAAGARAAGAAVVQNIRDTKAPGERWGARWRVAHRLAARTIVLSREMRDEVLRAVGAAPGDARVEAVYSAVDLERMRPPTRAEREAARASLGAAEGCFTAAYVAAFNPKKAQLELIRRAGPLLAARLPGAQVVFVGDFDPARSPYAAACRDAVAELGLGGVFRFQDFRADVETVYRGADAVLLASRQEGLARCMIEAMACGTPVVSFGVCSAREMLEGEGAGVVAPQGDYAAMVDALAALAADPAAAAEMGAKGARAARRLFEPARAVERYETMYLQLAEARP
jgi:glycosyltransferase involved in cell wall biosynthesis